MSKKLNLLVCVIVIFITGCTPIEDNRDYRESNIIILSGNYRLFQSSDEVNYIKGKMEKDPVKVDPLITYIGWNNKFIVYKRLTLENVEEVGILNVENGEVVLINDSIPIDQYLKKRGIKDIELLPVKQLIGAKQKELENDS